MGKQVDSVSIRPGVRILSVLRHLNYKPWFALAEFVDNALQSHLQNRAQLAKVDGPAPVKVHILLDQDDGGRITVRDNAAGIASRDYARAFRAAEVPSDTTGLSEFGMGMKSAACWFAPLWWVRTKALGETVERKVTFDIARILEDSLQELDVEERAAPTSRHFTEIVLTRPYSGVPVGRTLGKIKEHLRSIYRMYTRAKTLELRFNDDLLNYSDPPILRAVPAKGKGDKPLIWRKDIDLALGDGRRATGFAALRETGSTSEAGFALFRRGRLIEGSADEPFRPGQIFGNPNSYTFQRLFGELELDGFEVSHTKDGFRWGEVQDRFLAVLKAELNRPPLALIDQAEHYRAKISKVLTPRVAERIAGRTADAIEAGTPTLGALETADAPAEPPTALRRRTPLADRTLTLMLHGSRWEVILELTADPAVGDWVELGQRKITERKEGKTVIRQLHIRFSVDHPFTAAFAGANNECLEAQLRIAAGLCLSEVVARNAGVSQAGAIRRNLNELLRSSLSVT